jgi:7,8-dihydroneopterin aldolase/epimerase/oxygenase
LDEAAIAFEPPHARAAATGPDLPLDRISVRDYTRALEIGAFAAERGVTQRLRFNVVLEVAHATAAAQDDVDRVISYDTITEAIDAQLAAERVNLLETLAERLAARCLADPRAVRIFVRIEKLDRIPGTLGVEIVRVRQEDAARPRPVSPAASPGAPPRPEILFLPNDVLAGPHGAAWLEALAAREPPAILCVEPLAPQPSGASEAMRRIGLLSIEQNAWALKDRDPRFQVVATRTELDWAVRHGERPIWAPAKLVGDALGRVVPDASRPLALAAWLGAELGAVRLIAVGGAGPLVEGDLPVLRLAADRPDLLPRAAQTDQEAP